jgi:hypothetical protein
MPAVGGFPTMRNRLELVCFSGSLALCFYGLFLIVLYRLAARGTSATRIG